MRSAIAFAAMAILAGCGGSSTTSIPPSVDLTGAWSGTWTSVNGQVGQGSLDLTQTGSQVSGTVLVTGSPCFANADVSGTIEGDDFSGSMTAGGASATFDMTAATSQMSGTYKVGAAGACTGDTGTLTATR
jgi:hypothetical protein